MSGKWTQDERMQKAVDYLTAFDGGLAQHALERLDLMTPEEKNALKDAISLKGHKMYAAFGSSAKGMAVRALLLVQRAYLFLDTWSIGNGGLAFSWGKDGLAANSATWTKNYWLDKSETEVRAALGGYQELGTPSEEAVIEAAFQIKTGIINNPPPWEKLTRTMRDFPGGRVCFDGLCWWLFKAGYVSLRWMAKEKGRMVAQNANDILGLGHNVVDVDAGQWDLARSKAAIAQIPRGRLINWRGKGANHGVCHWAYTLGGGAAVGVNNSSAAAGPNGTLINTDFKSGGTEYGVFTIESMCSVYDSKLSRKGFIVATIHPHDIPTRI